MESKAEHQINPILVIGSNRSGTKYLSNQLSQHEDIACVRNDVTGIRETNMFNALANKFDLKQLDEYIGLVEMWSATDFFKRTSVEKELFYRITPRPRDTIEMFGILMTEFARRDGKGHWLQKACPSDGLALIRRFPTARVVLIQRKMIDQVCSRMANSYARPPWAALARATISYVSDRRCIDQIQSITGCPSVRFEDLTRDPEAVVLRLLKLWNLSVAGLHHTVQFRPNTSFRGNNNKSEYFKCIHIFWIVVCALIARFTPTFILARIVDRARRQNLRLVRGTFANVSDKFPQLRNPGLKDRPIRHTESSSQG